MKKLVFLEIVVLIVCSVFAYAAYDRNRSFSADVIQKEETVRQEKEELERLNEEYEQLLNRLNGIKDEENAIQLDLWKRRLDTLKEALR